MQKIVHLGFRASAETASALALMAHERGRSVSEEMRLALVERIAGWGAENDDDLAEQGEAVNTDSPKRATSDAVPAA